MIRVREDEEGWFWLCEGDVDLSGPFLCEEDANDHFADYYDD